MLLELARRVRPELEESLSCDGTAELRREIARVVPLYSGIEDLRDGGDSFQYGGPTYAGRRRVPDGQRAGAASPL